MVEPLMISTSRSSTIPTKLFKSATIYSGSKVSKQKSIKERLKEQWYIYYSVWDFSTSKWRPEKWWNRINDKSLFSNITERMEVAREECEAVNLILSKNINPKTKKSLTPNGKSVGEILLDLQKSSHAHIPTFSEAREAFLLRHTSDSPNKRNTKRTLKSVLNLFGIYLEKLQAFDKPVTEIRTSTVYAFMDEKYNTWVDCKRKGKKRQWGEQTYNNNFAYLNMFFNFLLKRKLIKENPIAKYERKDVLQVERFDPFPLPVAKEILEKLDKDEPYLALLARFVYYSFIRPGSELPRLRLKHIEVNSEGQRVIFLPKHLSKNKMDAHVDIDPELWGHLEPYLADCQDPEAFIFSNDLKPSHAPLTEYWVSKKFKKWLDKNGYGFDSTGKAYSMYSWKHTGVCIAKQSGWDTFDIMKKCRHKTEAETLKYLRSLGLAAQLANRPARIAI